MPVNMTSFLLPASTALPYLLEDKYLRGGMRCLATLADRDAMSAGNKKPGTLCYVTETNKMYQLDVDNVTWKDAKFGGSAYKFESPFVTAVDETGLTVVGLDPSSQVPEPEYAGMTLVSGANGTMFWVDMSGSENMGVRKTVEYEAGAYIQPGASVDFDLQMNRTLMLQRVELNAFDIELSAFESSERTDRNPYLFRSTANFLSDDGVFYEEDSEGNPVIRKLRRYSFLSNRDNTPTISWRWKNIGTSPAKPKLTVTYLVLE
ncbi:hypothetical protein HOS33_gp153 [Erwinia phage vB_EamM_Y3]|uniref:Uncharacterized protein n=1 Tax=Erwinia phage vB_EamM_Y3 TaxID=1983553 RepID=A0A2H4IB61_9CAUD|nr:hypothetical protein HOS33_gp153 [Erwinia phage vB_EamM_Y3]ARW58793.1 hypothetical protein Y3_153 [Erwinia phage vB_EamM_Y3]QZE56016.1 hypothetical protein pEaSNUABM52_00158 [Erwinia phage pEp_SNUABM_52]